MIKIEKTSFGYKLTLSGILTEAESNKWLEDSKIIIQKGPKPFSVLIDMQKIEILPVVCQKIMYEGQKLYKEMGMTRSVCIVTCKLTDLQFRLLAQKTGIYDQERYINSSQNSNWKKDAMNWLIHAIEPNNEYIDAI